MAMHGTVDPHDMLPGTEGDSDSQNVPPSRSSTFIGGKSLKTGERFSVETMIQEGLKIVSQSEEPVPCLCRRKWRSVHQMHLEIPFVRCRSGHNLPQWK